MYQNEDVDNDVNDDDKDCGEDCQQMALMLFYPLLVTQQRIGAVNSYTGIEKFEDFVHKTSLHHALSINNYMLMGRYHFKVLLLLFELDCKTNYIKLYRQ